MDLNYAPVLLFVYKRPEHTRSTLEALSNNTLASQSSLFIYADGPLKDASEDDLQKLKEVRKIIKEKAWCREVRIFESATNKGLARSVIEGVTEQIEHFESVIVLEDDLATSSGFLAYMNHALKKYRHEKQVMQISGFQFPLGLPAQEKSFFLKMTTSWGWATWKSAWDKFDPDAKGYEQLKSDRELAKRFDLNGTYPYTDMLINQMEQKSINSWAIRWWWTVFVNEGLTLFPDNSLVKNIGFGAGASHTVGIDPFENKNYQAQYQISKFPDQVQADGDKMLLLEALLAKTFSRSNSAASLFWRVVMKLKRIFTPVF